jgi:O-antigen ligase
MLYAMLLLASRGLLLALSVAVVALFVRETLRNPSRLAATLALASLMPLGLLLPGGQGVLQRFNDPGAGTAGGRTLIWSVVGSELAASGPRQLVFGHGFGASKSLVEQRFTRLSATHNSYLQVLYDLGLAGLLVFLALHLRVWIRAWRTQHPAGTVVMATTTFLLAANLGLNVPEYFLYWTIMGWFFGMAPWLSRPVPAEEARA